MNQVEQVDLMQTQILGLKELAQMVAVIDTCASRGTFKAEEFSTIGRLREIIIAESQAQAQIRQQSSQQEQTESLDGGVTEGNETSEPVVDAREKLKEVKVRSNGRFRFRFYSSRPRRTNNQNWSSFLKTSMRRLQKTQEGCRVV